MCYIPFNPEVVFGYPTGLCSDYSELFMADSLRFITWVMKKTAMKLWPRLS
jgi:hypothetical protein